MNEPSLQLQQEDMQRLRDEIAGLSIPDQAMRLNFSHFSAESTPIWRSLIEE